MEVDFYCKDQEELVASRTLDVLPRAGESVTVAGIRGIVGTVFWGDFVDGDGHPTGKMQVIVELV